MSDDPFNPRDPKNDRDTKYRFFPVVRRGYAPQEYYDAETAKEKATITTSGRLDIKFDVEGSGDTATKQESNETPIDMYGPGHITGLDSRQIVRMEPEPDTSNYPPNYFATVEFDAPDLPWLFSPVSDDTHAPSGEINMPKGRGLPWLCLVVIEKKDGISIEAAGTKPLPSVEVPVAELPPLDEAWAWAHAQTVGSPSQKGEASTEEASSAQSDPLKEAFGSQSTLTRSRLISPRNLQHNTRYFAAVVPVFEAGRQAGLGQAPAPDSNGNEEEGISKRMTLAWNPANTSVVDGSNGETVNLPLYHYWEFSTGKQGDFEYLARELEPVNLNTGDYDIGFADVDVTDPGPVVLDDLWDASQEDRTIRLGGALRQVNSSVDEYIKKAELRGLLNLPSEIEEVRDEINDEDGVVGPPIYGDRHAQVEELLAQPPDESKWLSDLNLHPGWRLAAAVGADIIGEQQEQLMASAWEQVGQIRAANRTLATAQLSREAMERKLRPLDGSSNKWLAQFTAPMHDRVMAGNKTVGAYLENSSVSRALMSASFRRLTSGSSQLANRLETPLNGPELLAGVVDGSFEVTAPADAPDGTGVANEAVNIRNLCGTFEESEPAPEQRSASAAELLSRLNEIKDICTNILEILSPIEENVRGAELIDEQEENVVILWDSIDELIDPLETWMQTVAEKEASVGLPKVSTQFTHEKASSLYSRLVDVVNRTFFESQEGEKPYETNIQDAQSDVFDLLRTIWDTEQYLYEGDPSDIAYLSDLVCSPTPVDHDESTPDLGTIVDAFDPVPRLLDRVGSQLSGINLRDRDDANPLDQVMAYPEFPTPMYRDLTSVSEDYLLPGINEVPKNSLGALETNPQFIESFMIGLNHEMASELLWRRYPTDRRGSYFRQFWDPSARIPKPDDLENLKDITEIHTWDDKPGESNLGSNIMTGAGGRDLGSPGQESEPTTNVVIVIRGEVLRRYPQTTIYAAKAKYVDRSDSSGMARVPKWPIAEETRQEVDDTYHRFPIFRGEIDPDVSFLGVDLTAEEAVGEARTESAGDPSEEWVDADGKDDLGWFFVMEEAPGEVRFGLDANQDDVDGVPNGITYHMNGSTTTETTANPDTSPEHGWSGLSWGHLVSSQSMLEAKDNVSIYRDRPGEEGEEGSSWHTVAGNDWALGPNGESLGEPLKNEEAATWGKNSAHMAYITWQRPVRIAIHADDLLPNGPGDENEDGSNDNSGGNGE